MISSHKARALVLGLSVLPILAFGATEAEAAGFAIREQSTAAQGNSFAGAPTGIDDPSYMFWNPAMMTYLPGIQATSSASQIIPNAEFNPGSASAVSTLQINTTSEFDGNKDIGRDALVPSFATTWAATDDVTVGLSITAPFGLLTDNPDGWIGRYHALKSQLTTYDFNPAVAYRVNDSLSIGAGFRAIYAEAELSQMVDLGTAAAGPPDETTDSRAKLQGDDWGFGASAGIMYEPFDRLRLGLGYRSRVDLKLEGDLKFEPDTAGLLTGVFQPGGFFVDTDATAATDLPETITFGANYDIDDQWSVMGQVEWTNWSEFDELVVKVDQGAQGDSVTEEDWDDSWFFALGTTYRPNWLEHSTLRFGVAYELSSVPDDTRTPRIPDNDRVWLSFGAGYDPTDWLSLSLAYTYIFVEDASIDLTTTGPTDLRGNLSGEYDADVNIISLQGSIKF